MGKGYDYKCKKCGHEYWGHQGATKMYSEVYREKFAEIAAGAYGTELKELIDNTDNVFIDAREVLYICSSCNRWELGTDVTLYMANDPDSILKEYEIKTAADWGLVPYRTKDYHVLNRHYHKCKKCGRRMHKASEEEEQNLSCPKCGEPNQPNGFFIWD